MTAISSMTESCMCKRQRSGQKSRSKGSKRESTSRRDAALALENSKKTKTTDITSSLAEEIEDLILQGDLLKEGNDEIRKE